MYFDKITKKVVLEEGKVVPLSNDLVFKNVVKNVVNRDFLAKIINLVTGIDYDYLFRNMIVIDADIPDKSIFVHHNEQDVVVTIDNKYINVEMSNDKAKNKRKNEITSHKYASSMYVKGSDYSESYIFYQIAIENYNIFKNSDLVIEVGLTDLKNGEIETDEFRKFHVNLKNVPNKCYNELSERERYFKLFLIDDIEELDKISMGDDIMKKVVETVKSLSNDPIFMSELEKQQLDEYCSAMAIVDAKKEGKVEGKKENQIEMAKRMLDDNIEKENISKYTGLSIDEINNL
jgi:predicted transposase/invertase (TIGR01784 family)